MGFCLWVEVDVQSVRWWQFHAPFSSAELIQFTDSTACWYSFISLHHLLSTHMAYTAQVIWCTIRAYSLVGRCSFGSTGSCQMAVYYCYSAYFWCSSCILRRRLSLVRPHHWWLIFLQTLSSLCPCKLLPHSLVGGHLDFYPPLLLSSVTIPSDEQCHAFSEGFPSPCSLFMVVNFINKS